MSRKSKKTTIKIKGLSLPLQKEGTLYRSLLLVLRQWRYNEGERYQKEKAWDGIQAIVNIYSVVVTSNIPELEGMGCICWITIPKGELNTSVKNDTTDRLQTYQKGNAGAEGWEFYKFYLIVPVLIIKAFAYHLLF